MMAKRKILLVENNRECGYSIRRMFEQSGYEISVALDAPEIVDYLSREKFDLIIAGSEIPALRATELIQEVKRLGSTAPVVFLTAYGSIESHMNVMNMGACDYINKPVTERQVVSIVERVSLPFSH